MHVHMHMYRDGLLMRRYEGVILQCVASPKDAGYSSRAGSAQSAWAQLAGARQQDSWQRKLMKTTAAATATAIVSIAIMGIVVISNHLESKINS